MKAPPVGLAAGLAAALLLGGCGGAPAPDTGDRRAQLDRARAARAGREARQRRREATEARLAEVRLPYFCRSLLEGARWEPAPEEARLIEPGALLAFLRLPDSLAAGLSAASPSPAPLQGAEGEANERGSALCRPTRSLGVLAFPGARVLLCHPYRRTSSGLRFSRPSRTSFGNGCLQAHQIRYDVVNGEENSQSLSTPEELIRALAPIESEAEALGLVALAYAEHLVAPARWQRAERLSRSIETWDWREQLGAPQAAYEVEAAGGGFLVRVPVMPVCGRSHPILRVEIRVERDGRFARTDRDPEVIAAPGGHAPIVD